MEGNNEETEQASPQPQLIVSEEMRSYIYDTTKWAKFLAIVGFGFTALIVISAFSIGSSISLSPQQGTLMSIGSLSPWGLTLIFLAYALAIFYPSFLLFRYATKAKIGVLYGEQASLDEALGKMKSLFKYWGIMTILFLVFYAVAIGTIASNGVASKNSANVTTELKFFDD